MSDKLLQYYEKELAFLQLSSSDFAKKHPGVAGGLQITEDAIQDPLVNQLLSGVAYMNARIHQKLDDDFPEISDAILDTLYPHYLRPIPSLAIVQYSPMDDLDKVVTLERGTELQTTSDRHDVCKFTTGYNTDIAPISVKSVRMEPKPFVAPGSDSAPNAETVLKIALSTFDSDIKFSELEFPKLRIFFKGPKQHTFPLYDLMLGGCEAVSFATSATGNALDIQSSDCISPVGFSSDEALLPYPDNSFSGYRLLSEYFTFTEKFLFIDIALPENKRDLLDSDELHISVFLNEHNSELENQVSPNMLALNCTPVINLFPQTADPIRVTHTDYSYPIEPDARKHLSYEVYSVDDVTSINERGQKRNFHRFYGANHKMSPHEKLGYWFAQREPVIEGEHNNEYASEVSVGIVDLEFNPYEINNQTLEVNLQCTNRNLPSKLPTSNGQPHLALTQGDAPLESIACILPPTDSIQAPQGRKAFWRLISHLNLNHLSLTQNESSLDALKEILRLYDLKQSASTRNRIESIQSITTKAITAPIHVDGTTTLCRGIEITLTLDPRMLNGTSTLIFANLLNRFFGLYCSINSFSKLNVKLSGHDGIFYKWQPRAGEKPLL